MKYISFLFAMLCLVGVAKAQDTNATDSGGCGDISEPRCYCSSGMTTNENCDVSKLITYIFANTTEECQDHCTTECGDGAGYSFACYPKGEEMFPCDKTSQSCECNSCDYNGDYPSKFQFGDQCAAFCSRADVCGVPGGISFMCGTSGAAAAAASAYLGLAAAFGLALLL